MKKINSIFILLLISGLFLLTACGDINAPEDFDLNDDATLDTLSMSVISSSIIELDWEQIESPYTYSLFRRADGGTEQLIYHGEKNFVQDDGLQNGVMYCYQLKSCESDCVEISNSVCSPTREWKSHGNAPWSPRYYPSSVVFKDNIWVLGGKGPVDGWLFKYHNDVWAFTGSAWSLATSAAPWSARCMHASVVFKDKIWVLGGVGNSQRKNDVWASGDGKNWELVTDQAPWKPRDSHTSLVFKDKIWALAGRVRASNLNGDEEWLYEKNDVWSSSDGKNWELMAKELPWQKGVGHNFVVFDDKIWMLEGSLSWLTSATKNVWSSSDGKNWVKEIINGTRQTGNNALVFKDRIWLTGGRYGSEKLSSEVWFSEDGSSWIQDSPALWEGRARHVNLVFQDRIWIMGGSGSDGQKFNDVWSY